MRIAKQILKYLGLAALVFVLLMFVLGVWVISGNKLTSAKQKAYNTLPIPAAFVGGRPLLMRDFLQRMKVVETFYAQNSDGRSAASYGAVMQNLVEEKKLVTVASAKGVVVSENQVNEELKRRNAGALKNENQSLESLISRSGLTEKEYKEAVVAPDLLATGLTVWFNGQKDLNSSAFLKAEEYERRIKAGEKLEDLARQYSDDQATKPLEGDLGFIGADEILPELQEGLDSLSQGETKILPSRYGLHVVKLYGKDTNGPGNSVRMHLKQIFIKSEGFKQWYDNEASKIKTRTIIKI